MKLPALRVVVDRRKKYEGEQPAVYFLFDGDQCTYVGQSVVPMRRIAEHRRARKVFDSYSLWPCKREELSFIESFFIHLLQPRDNGKGGPNIPDAKGCPLTLAGVNERLVQLVCHDARYECVYTGAPLPRGCPPRVEDFERRLTVLEHA